MVKDVSLSVLVEDSTRDDQKLIAKYGLSFLIEVEVKNSENNFGKVKNDKGHVHRNLMKKL